METDYAKIKVNPIFEPIKRIFEFFILGVGFVGQKEFQTAFLLALPDLRLFVETYNKEVNLRIEGRSVKSETGPYWVSIGRLMAIAIFDILQFSKYHNVVKNTEIFKFTKHIRNGAAHDNRFDLSPPIEGPVTWGVKTITNSLNNTKVFPDFMSPTALIYLMADISGIIEGKVTKVKKQQTADTPDCGASQWLSEANEIKNPAIKPDFCLCIFLPIKRSSNFVFRDARLKEILFFTEVNRFAHPREGVGGVVLKRQAYAR